MKIRNMQMANMSFFSGGKYHTFVGGATHEINEDLELLAVMQRSIDAGLMVIIESAEEKAKRVEMQRVRSEEESIKAAIELLKAKGISLEAGDVLQKEESVVLRKMSRDELEEYAREKYGVDLDKRKAQATLVKEVKELGG